MDIYKDKRFEFRMLEDDLIDDYIDDILELHIYDFEEGRNVISLELPKSSKNYRVLEVKEIVELLNKTYLEGFKRGNEYGFENGYDACIDEYSIST